jgi:NAD(P)-dependent dehydrogenase (short-subunit alcohol dehydrogenase family)
MTQGSHLIKRGIRINCISPGPTETPMMPHFEANASPHFIDVFTEPIGRRSTPAEQALPLIFLNSDAATYVNGHNLNVDAGFVGGVTTGQIDLQASLARAAEMSKA